MGAMTLSIMTFSILTFGIMTISIMTLSMMSFNATLSLARINEIIVFMLIYSRFGRKNSVHERKVCTLNFFYEIPGFVLTKPSWDWDWVNYSRPDESLVSEIPAGDGNTAPL